MIHLNIGSNLSSFFGSRYDNITIAINLLIESKLVISKVSNFYPGWENNKLICDNSSLEKICKELERRYDIKIQFQDNLQKNTTISGIIDLSPNNLNSVLSSISLLSKRKFKLQGDSYILL